LLAKLETLVLNDNKLTDFDQKAFEGLKNTTVIHNIVSEVPLVTTTVQPATTTTTSSAPAFLASSVMIFSGLFVFMSCLFYY
jgi:hypothetical protein